MALIGLNLTFIFKYKYYYRSHVLKQILEIQIMHIFMLHKSCMYNFDSYKSLTCYMDDSTAQFKLYACVSVHTCVCMFTACKTLKIGLHMHCYTQFWHVHDCQWTHITNEWCTSWARTWFATLHVWYTGTVDTYRQ